MRQPDERATSPQAPSAARTQVQRQHVEPDGVLAYLDAQEAAYEQDRQAEQRKAASASQVAKIALTNIERITGAIGQIHELRDAMRRETV